MYIIKLRKFRNSFSFPIQHGWRNKYVRSERTPKFNILKNLLFSLSTITYVAWNIKTQSKTRHEKFYIQQALAETRFFATSILALLLHTQALQLRGKRYNMYNIPRKRIATQRKRAKSPPLHCVKFVNNWIQWFAELHVI